MAEELQELREKLAIAKQMLAIVGDRIHSVITLDGLTVDKSEGDIYFAYPKEEYRRPQESLAWGTDAIEVAYLARQKLAAERAEAELPERAKKWKRALETIAHMPVVSHDQFTDLRNVARQALES